MSLILDRPAQDVALASPARSAPRQFNRLVIVGTGFVADFYMRSLSTFPDLQVVMAYDSDPARLEAFCKHWNVPPANSLSDLLRADADLVLNLTNPYSHHSVSHACLEAGHHVYSEKPLATSMAEAHALFELAERKKLILASAPCSLLGEAAQTAMAAIRAQRIGKVRLVYAELDDGFLKAAPFRDWRSASGAPWPYRDEFRVGCTLEHAGYYLTWLMAMFGPVDSLISASAETIPDKLDGGEPTAPDFSCATLFFRNGVVARLTCSIVASHDHRLRIYGDEGILEFHQCWNNHATVRVRKRHVLRRRLIDSPFARRVRLRGSSHPRASRWGATAMNFALGPVEVLAALKENRPSRLSAEFGLHLNEVTLAIQEGGGSHRMKTSCSPIEPMSWAVLR